MPIRRVPATQDELESILDDAESGQQAGQAASPMDEYSQRLDAAWDDVQSKTQALKQSVAYGVKQNPDEYARLLDLQQRTGVAPQLGKEYEQHLRQQADARGINYPQLVQSNPILARQLADPNFASVAHDDLDSLTRIENGAAALRPPGFFGKLRSEYASFAGNTNAAAFGVAKPFIDAGGTLAQNLLESPKALLNVAAYGDPGLDQLKDIWVNPRRHWIQDRVTGPVENWLTQDVQQGPAQYVSDPATGGMAKNPAYRWWGRPLVNTVEQVPGTLAAFALTGRLAGVGAGAAGVDSAGVESQAVPAILGTQSAQTTYAQARAKGVDQKEAVLAALASGMADYTLMGRMPGAVPTSTAAGALAQWAGRSVAMGTAMTGTDNAIARSYDPDRGLLEGLPQSIATMAAFEGVGTFPEVLGHITDAVEASKLRKRSPQAFQQHADAAFEGQESLRIPAQDFVNYFAGKNVDPAEAANRIGVTNLGEAIAAGSELEVPTANYFGKLEPEDQKGLRPDIVDPATNMTTRQAEAGRKELEDWVSGGGVEQLQAEYAQADAETQATPEWKQVYGDLKQRYVDAGESETAADSYATLQANAIASLAKRAGLKPDELLALHNPKLTVGASAPGTGEARLQEALDPEEDDGTLYQARPGDSSDRRKARNLEAAKVQGEMLTGGEETAPEAGTEKPAAEQPIADRLLVHNDWGDTGREFMATMGSERLKPGDVIAENKDGVALKVLSLEGKTSQGVQWYKFQTVDADAARAAGETVIPNAKGKPASEVSTKVHQGEQPRGWFRVLPDGRYEIGKTKLGDLSTFVHEPAHAYLELFRELTQREGASDPLKDDFRKIAEWLGTTPEDAYKNGFTREQHEQWARANEQYVREGQAPTSGLQRAFHNFATWLGSIYRRASALGVELSGDIRGVMDRLYAGEAAVDRAEQEAGRKQLFESPEDAGWTEEEYRNYAEAKGVEVDKAREQVRAELNDAAVRERTQAWREEKSNVRDAVTDQVDARPEYKAIRSLRRGKTDLGTDLTLNRDELVKQFGEERVKALQDLHRGLYRKEGGTDAETAAELLGFGSGEEMIRALEGTPRRGQAIEQATREAMTARHGDIRYDGSLEDKARLAVENGERAKNLHRELAALKAKMARLQQKAADAKAAMRAITIAPLEQYQEAARQMVDQKSIADLQPHRYLDASRKYSREAFEALRKGNVTGAADAKNKELLNHFLFREASAARDYVEKFESYVKRVQSRGIQQRLGLAGSDYRDQFNWLMARYKLGGTPPMPERSLRAWADDVFDQGNEVAIAPGILKEGKFADYRNVPISELRDVHDALVNIRTLAQREFKMYVQGKQVAFAEAKQAMIESARTNLKTKPERIFQENRTAADKLFSGLQWVDSRLIRMERLVEWLDGGKTGPWHDNLWNLASDAQGDEYKLQELVTQRVTDALADMPTEMRRRLWTEKVNVEGIPEPLPRRRMLSMAFNMGNEGNLDRLRKTFDSFGWDRDAIGKIGGMLTREEWSFVQKSWESLKPLGERMVELEKRLTGLPPQMVKVTPFKVALEDGTEMDLAGGYFPIAMDPRFSQRAIEQDSKGTAQNAMQAGYVRATTSKGYTKERTGFGGPLLLDYEQVLTSHVAKVAKDLSHREFMLASQRFLLDTEMRRALRESLGPAYEQQFMPWLRTIINDNNGSVQERLDGLKDLMQKTRGNVVAASLGFNASTSLLQISHAPRMLLYAKTGSLAQAFVDLLAHPVETSREIRDLSPNEMRFRGDNLDRDIRAVLQNPTYQAGYTRKVAVAARFALEVMDHLLSHTLWKAAYRDSLDKYADLPVNEAQEKAAHEADSAVRLGLGTSAPKDLPAIMRSNEFNKFITTLYGFHNGVYNQLRDIGHQFRYDRNIGKATMAGVLTVVLPAVLGNLLTGRGPKDGENVGWWAAKRSLLFAADTVPLLRSVASFMDGGHDVQFSPIESVMQKAAKTTMAATSDKEDKDWLGIGLDASEVAGKLGGVPGSQQLVKTLRYFKRASEGKVQNPGIWGALVGGR